MNIQGLIPIDDPFYRYRMPIPKYDNNGLINLPANGNSTGTLKLSLGNVTGAGENTNIKKEHSLNKQNYTTTVLNTTGTHPKLLKL